MNRYPVLKALACAGAVGSLAALAACGSGNAAPAAEGSPNAVTTTASASAIATTASPNAASTCGKNVVQITSPAGDVLKNTRNGIEIDIKTCGMQPGYSLWLLDRSDDGNFTLDTGANGDRTPVTTATYSDVPFGDQGAVNVPGTIMAIVASPECSKDLAATQPNSDGNFEIDASNFPKACVSADNRKLDVVYTY